MPQLTPAALRPKLRVTLLSALILLPALGMWRLIDTYQVPLPLGDEWSTPGALYISWCNGTLTLPELFAQHNESRKLFPRLLYLGMAALSGWDVRDLMVVTFIVMCTTVALFYRLLRITPDSTPQSALIATMAASLFTFAPNQLDNFLWGIQLETFFPGCAVVAIALINLSRLSLLSKAALNGALALVATYTAAHGMLLWVLGVPLLQANESWRNPRPYLIYAGYFICAAVAIGGYFIGYISPVHHPTFFAGSVGIIDYGRYLTLWVGSYLASPLTNSLAAGIAALLLCAGAVVGSCALIRRTGSWRTFYAGFVILGYAGATAALTAVGRIGIGVEQALEPRYRTFSLFFYLGLVALLYALDCSLRAAHQLQRRVFRASCFVTAAAVLVTTIASYDVEVRRQEIRWKRNLTLRRALEWMEVIPDNPDFSRIFPDPSYLLPHARKARDHRLLRLSWVNDEMAQKARLSPPLVLAEDSSLRFETCAFDANHRLWITGIAWLSEANRRADCILIGAIDATGNFKPISVMETGVFREELRTTKRRLAGFARTFNPANVPAGDITIAAWAVDLKNQELHPVGGAKLIPAHER